MESESLTIRCPECSQRFKVSGAVEGKTVECGSCDHRFRVDDEVIVRSKRFYPGERKDASLARFGRAPMTSSPELDFEPAMHQGSAGGPADHSFEPVFSPQRVIFGLVAVFAVAVVALVLIFGGGPGGVLDGASMSKRLILAGFTVVVASLLLFLANPGQRYKAVFGSIAFAAGLFCLPFFFRQGLPVVTEDRLEQGEEAVDFSFESQLPTVEDPFASLKSEMGYAKVEEALSEYGPSGVHEGRTAIGIWVRDIRLFNLDQVFDFLVRSTGANSEESWSYPRPPTDHLVILKDVAPDLSEVAALCGEFGKVTRSIEELNLIEVVVNNELFRQGPQSKLQDPEDPDFYKLNRLELESIDLNRIQAAVKRIADVEPRVFRNDISTRLQELLSAGDLEMKRDVARALTNWAVEGDGSVHAVREVTSSLLAESEDVPDSLVQFLVEARDVDSLPLIHQLWKADFQDWESLYGEMGEMIEGALLAEISTYEPLLQLSAIRLLARVGSTAALPYLQAIREEASAEMKVSIDRAVDVIRERS
ncbi:MAG: MJ0042-type zinc finger domain-containing protein [Verrucomicrobiales bacterium]